MTIALPQLAGSNVLTNSRMASFRACPRKHYFAYERGWRPEGESAALRIGSNIHRGIEALNRGANAEQATAEAIRYYAGEETAIEAEKVRCLMGGYAWRWSDWPGQTIATEQPFEITIKGAKGRAMRTFKVAGKIDRVVRLDDGRLAVLETKTTGESIAPDSIYWEQLAIDQQISLYMLAARAIGFEVETVIYDVIHKPGLEPKQIPLLDDEGFKQVVDTNTGERVRTKDGKKWRESPDASLGWVLLTREETPDEYAQRLWDDITQRTEHYYARRVIPRLETDLDEFRVELVQQAAAIREAQKSGRWFRNTSNCKQYGRCPYLGICKSSHAHDAAPSGYVQLNDIHPELAAGDETL